MRQACSKGIHHAETRRYLGFHLAYFTITALIFETQASLFNGSRSHICFAGSSERLLTQPK